MEWTKIPTNLLNFDDKEILALVKYQLVWALAEEEPNQKMLKRYLTKKQLAIACGHNADVSLIVRRDIESVQKKRTKDNLRYKLTHNTNAQISPSETVGGSVGGSVGVPLSQIREDKIRYITPISPLKDDKAFVLQNIANQNKQCDCITDSTQERCQRKATYEINGKYYCNQHSKEKISKLKDFDISKRFTKPTIAEIKAYCLEKGYDIDAEYYYNYNEARGWMLGKNHMKSWKANLATWNSMRKKSNNTPSAMQTEKTSEEKDREYRESMAKLKKQFEEEYGHAF